MNITTLYQIFQSCSEVTTDSRVCPPNSLFIALKGDSFNGNKFAAQALKDGCSYAVIDEPQYAVEGDERYIVVDDSLTALQQLANHHRRQFKCKVIGITGTNGKTTTKELMAAVLSRKYRVLFTMGNFNNHIGVPLTLLRLTAEHDLAVIEMGANHPGEIDLLARIAEPDFGIITNVGKAHLEGFGSFEGVIKTKGELYDFLRERPEATVFVHHENPYLMDMTQGLNLIAYGTQKGLYVNGRVTENAPFLTFEWRNGESGATHSVKTQLIGEYNFLNALAAITIGYYFGVSPAEINHAIEAYTPQNNRSQLKETADNTLIVDAYNANPTSMMAALENFRKMSVPNKMVILGDMKELGSDSKSEHQKAVDYLKESSFEEVILVGECFSETIHPFRSYPDVSKLIEALQKSKPKGMTILIKGSNGIKLIQAVDYL